MYNKETKHLNFREVEDTCKKTKTVLVENKNKELLGFIYFKPQWRKFVFDTNDAIVYDNTCLRDIVSTLDELQQMWIETLKKK